MNKVHEMKKCLVLLLVVCGLGLSAEEPVRIWTDLKGGKIKASFVRFEDDEEIVIRRADGMLFQVHPSVFSAADRKYLYELSTLFRSSEPVRFKDAKLEAAVRTALKKPKGPVTRQDMTTIRDLTAAPNSNITKLDGLQYAINLAKLSVGFNQIRDVTPLIRLDNLKRLDLKYNKISDVTLLTRLTKLEYLALHGNRIHKDQKKVLLRALPSCKIKFDPQLPVLPNRR